MVFTQRVLLNRIVTILLTTLMHIINCQNGLDCFECTVFNRDQCCNTSGLERCCNLDTRPNGTCPVVISHDSSECQRFRCNADGQCPSGFKCCPGPRRVCIPKTLIGSTAEPEGSKTTHLPTRRTTQSTIAATSRKTNSEASSTEKTTASPRRTTRRTTARRRRTTRRRTTRRRTTRRRTTRRRTTSRPQQTTSSTTFSTTPQRTQHISSNTHPSTHKSTIKSFTHQDVRCPLSIPTSSATSLRSCASKEQCDKDELCCPIQNNDGCCYK